MPHPVDLRTHASHDLELVAAYAAGDAAGPDLETATALVAGCPDCSTLHHDLRLIAAALPALPAPVRPRDFRLTPGQAASLRPAGWRGLLRAFAGPRFSFAAPLGTGLATLGLAGLLVGTLAGTPLGAGAGRTAANGSPDNAFSSAPPEFGGAAYTPKDEVSIQGEASPTPAASSVPGDVLQPVPAPTQAAQPFPRDAATDNPAPGLPLLALTSAVVLVTGAVLVAVRLVGRRVARAP